VSESPEPRPVYALNLFDVADRDEYLAHSRRSPEGSITGRWPEAAPHIAVPG
jgi:hypothetical protein